MSRKSSKALQSPAVLEPFDEDDKSSIRVVVETPKGRRNKYKFEPAFGAFTLSKVLPDGMVFPYDFGFVPSTLAEDGDPIDVLILMDEPAFTGCILPCRLIGVIEGTETEGGKSERNDRLVAVPIENHDFSELKNISGMNKTLLKEICRFFVNYHGLDGITYKVLGISGPKEATRLLKKAVRRAKGRQ